MKSRIKKYIPGEKWVISVNGWDRGDQGVRESQFTLGNGFIGSRGILEEIPYDAHPGTYIAGIYDRMGSKVSDLVNLPNPINFKISIGGERLDVSIMPNVKHQRYLNMKHGILARHTIYETAHKSKIDYQSVRFFSMKDKNIAAMRIYLTPLNKPCTVTIGSDIDTSVSNVSGISEGRKKHFKIKDIISSEEKTISYIEGQTLRSKISISYAHTLNISLGGKKWFSKEENLVLKLKKGQTAVFTKFYSVFTQDESESFDIKNKAIKTLETYIALGYDELMRRHCNSWERLWRQSDIKIKGNWEIQRNLRFNIYHLLIAGIDNDGRSSIGAKTLSGEGYRGHIFWDLEIFILPFFMFVNPSIAKSMLLYRAKRLEKAKEIARSNGYSGAMFPWESALTGEEQTPSWARDLDGSIIKIHTHEMECHITADIAYSVYRYYVATEDNDFMLKYGYELLLETARFWSSRTSHNKRKKRFQIRGVIGPDEFHEDVDNNAYTNMLAQWNVFIAYGMFMRMKKEYPENHAILIKKLNLTTREVKIWKDIISKMSINIRKDGVIEQFDGFFKRKKVKITEFDEDLMPLIPRDIKLKDIGKYQIIKQADVLLLLYLFPDRYDLKTKKRNYNFYDPITVHKSSLSPAIHSIMASETGQSAKSYSYFLMSLNTDILNLHRNTRLGIHAANLGGTWQTVIHGFAGMRIIKETLSFDPRMPKDIKGMSFFVQWKGFVLHVTIDKDVLKIKCFSKLSKKKSLKVRLFGKIFNISPGKTFISKKERAKKEIHIISRKHMTDKLLGQYY